MQNKLAKCCKKLRLSANFVENAITKNATLENQEYLLHILEEEILHRAEKRRQLNMKRATFDTIKTFKDYDFSGIQIPKTLSVDLIKQADFINRKENLILYGRNGNGKSQLATAIGIEAIMQDKKVKFYKTATLVNELIDAKANGILTKYLKKLSKLDVLICDEWGYIPFDAEGSQLLFQVIADCYEKRSLIITTNIEFSKWNGIFYDDELTAALIDRLVHYNSHLLVFNQESYRLKHSLRRLRN